MWISRKTVFANHESCATMGIYPKILFIIFAKESAHTRFHTAADYIKAMRGRESFDDEKNLRQSEWLAPTTPPPTFPKELADKRSALWEVKETERWDLIRHHSLSFLVAQFRRYLTDKNLPSYTVSIHVNNDIVFSLDIKSCLFAHSVSWKQLGWLHLLKIFIWMRGCSSMFSWQRDSRYALVQKSWPCWAW